MLRSMKSIRVTPSDLRTLMWELGTVIVGIQSAASRRVAR
jgi:hypothetical protein